ncbi:MAG: RagB/SusD family nutrient uptake outer membrane protein [Prevotella sp.]
MKRTIYFLITSAMLSLVFSSCNDWLTVPVDGKSTSTELYTGSEGYRASLNGIYKGLAVDELYGLQLQYGVIDFFSNQYRKDMPQDELNSTIFIAAGKREFKNVALQPVLNSMWMTAYNRIAATNDLIDNVSKASDSKFRQGEMERKMIYGEALAIRALLHFDMLRLFAPAPINDDGQTYIPYITTFPEILGTHISVKAALDMVIKDLEDARELVKLYDFSPLGMSANASGKARFYNTLESGMEGYNNATELDEFFFGRGYRFSYWAISGLLARAYQYKAAYDASFYEKAKVLAQEILDAKCTDVKGGTSYYPFKNENFGGFAYVEDPEQMENIRMVGNLLLGIYRDNEAEQKLAEIAASFPREKRSPAQYNFCAVDVNGQDIFKTTGGVDESKDDIRCSRLLFKPINSYNVLLSTKWYVKTRALDEGKRTLNIFPILRTSEMRFIIAETLARNNEFDKAYEILNEMRRNRGLYSGDLPTQSSLDGFLKDLVREGQREWISEGQLFYLYKRLNFAVKRHDGTMAPFKNEECVVPLPIEELR